MKDLLEIHKMGGGGPRKKKLIHAVILTTIWCIWKTRNEAIFKGKRSSLHGLLEEIKSLSFLWTRNRLGTRSITWEERGGFDL
ncbi:hypothetical protein R6Q59_031878 [Mikania micrantha]